MKVKAGDDISQLFACQATADVNIKKLFMYRTVDCLILDSQRFTSGLALLSKETKSRLRILILKKDLNLTLKDQIEELERRKDEGSMAFISLHCQ